MTLVRSFSARSVATVLGPLATAVAALTGVSSVFAQELPFQRTSTAVVEDDDERVFEMSLSHLTGKKERSSSLQLGYSFSPTLSMEVELGAGRDKVEDLSSRQQGMSIWNAWIDPAREGWGLAGELSVERERSSGARWENPEWRGTLAFSLPLDEKTLWLHANLGARYQSPEGDSRRWTGTWSLAAQKDLNRQFQVFGEVAGDGDGSDRLAQVGLRTWLKREKYALDVGVGRQFADERRGNFVSVSFSVFDISP